MTTFNDSTTGRIDTHGHFLPGVDDGCASVEESFACARTLVANGYTHAFCTPHIWPSLPENNVVAIKKWTDALQSQLHAESIPLTLLPGGELNLQAMWPFINSQPIEEIVTYALAGKYVLFDFWSDVVPEFFEPAVEHLRSIGLTPILGHPERVYALQHNKPAMRRVLATGVLMQCNTWCLADRPGQPTRDTAEWLLKEGRYFMFGTDTHNPQSMKQRMEGLNVAEKMVGVAEVERLTITNPRMLLP